MELDVLCFGEVLVDWVSTEATQSLESARAFEKAPGGAPANAAVALARLGASVGFAGGLSPDPFGRWLRSLLRRSGVDVDAAIEIDGTQTRMAYVLRTHDGDRRLAAFSTVGVADRFYTVEHVGTLRPDRAAIFHFGSVTLASEPSGEATRAALKRARDAGCVISFDPNVRLALWSSAEAAARTILPLLSAADIVKVSSDEVELLTGIAEPERGAALLWERYKPALLAVTLGARGAFLRHEAGTVHHGGYRVEVVEATGAGDAFLGGILRAIAARVRSLPRSARRACVERLDVDSLNRMLAEACALGALATTRTGAMAGLPTSEQLKAFLEERGR